MIGLLNYVNAEKGVESLSKAIDNSNCIEFNSDSRTLSSERVTRSEVYCVLISNGVELFLTKDSKILTESGMYPITVGLPLVQTFGSIFIDSTSDLTQDSFFTKVSSLLDLSIPLNKLVDSWNYNLTATTKLAWQVLLYDWKKSLFKACFEISCDYEIPNIYQGSIYSPEFDLVTLDFIKSNILDLIKLVEPDTSAIMELELENILKFQGAPFKCTSESIAQLVQASIIKAGFDALREGVNVYYNRLGNKPYVLSINSVGSMDVYDSEKPIKTCGFIVS